MIIYETTPTTGYLERSMLALRENIERLQRRIEDLEHENAMLECLLHESRQRESLLPDPEFF